MTNSIKTDVLSISVQPYCQSSRLATDFPAFEAFTSRTQFIPFGQLSKLAVRIDLYNKLYDNSRHHKTRQTLYVNLRNRTSGDIISSRTVCVEIPWNVITKSERVDLPLRRDMIDDAATYYTVEVSAPSKSDGMLMSKSLEFIAVKKLPTKYYNPVSAYMERPEFSSELDLFNRRLTSVGSTFTFNLEVTFRLENTVTESPRLPELFMRFVGKDGHELIERCSLSVDRTCSGGDGTPVVEASCMIPQQLRVEGFVYAELQSMGYAFAAALFGVGSEDEEGELMHDDLRPVKSIDDETAMKILEVRKETYANLMRQNDRTDDNEEAGGGDPLESLVGLADVKSKLEAYRCLMTFYAMRRRAGLPVPTTPLHCIFLGSPGTGKTTVAKRMGEILHECGALSSGHVVVRERSSLIGRFYGDEEKKTLEAIQEAHGGILFIDEAYQLHQTMDPKDPGRLVIESLMTALADTANRDWMLILAGYEGPMLDMLKLNPGLASRIPSSNMYRFADFSVDELYEIAVRYLNDSKFTLSDLAGEKLRSRLAADYACRDSSFGNARHVVNVIETEILPAMGRRISAIDNPTIADLTTLLPGDIPVGVTIRPVERRIGFAC